MLWIAWPRIVAVQEPPLKAIDGVMHNSGKYAFFYPMCRIQAAGRRDIRPAHTL